MSKIIKAGQSGLIVLSIFSVAVVPGLAQPSSEHNSSASQTNATSGSGSQSAATSSSATAAQTENRSSAGTENSSGASSEAGSNAGTMSSSESGFPLGSAKDGNPRDLPSGPPGGIDPNAGLSKLWGSGVKAPPSKPAAKAAGSAKVKAPAKPQIRTYK